MILRIIGFSMLLGLVCLSQAKVLEKEQRRVSEYPIENLLLKRQSKYALHRTLSKDQMKEKLQQLFTAFIWAPSSYNNQPGRIVYGIYGTKAWNGLFQLLVPFNKEWVKNAGALLLIVSSDTFEYNKKPSKTHSLDTGASMQNLLLQAEALGLVGHAIEGFDYEKARKNYKIPKGYTLECMVAIGEPAPLKYAKKEFMERDKEPAKRKKISEFTFEGAFKR